MQSKADLESFYTDPDPWGYKSNIHDNDRLKRILRALSDVSDGVYTRALDIGAGEGFLTEHLPAHSIDAIEISDAAASRLPAPIRRVHAPDGKYDLIVATGVLYSQYDHIQMTKWIEEAASHIVLTCNIKDWEINDLPKDKIIREFEFPYREYVEHLVIYDFTA